MPRPRLQRYRAQIDEPKKTEKEQSSADAEDETGSTLRQAGRLPLQRHGQTEAAAARKTHRLSVKAVMLFLFH